MNKVELADYLVNLHTLMQAQTSNVSNASATLAEEYERCWGQLKETIQDEARKSAKQSDGIDKDRADQQSNQPGRGQPDRRSGSSYSEAHDLRPRIEGSDGKSN